MKKSFQILFSFILLLSFSVFAQNSTTKDSWQGQFTKQVIPQGQSIPLQYDGIYDLLWNNGPIVTHPGGGFGGADASACQTSLGMINYGIGAQISASNTLADDFTISANSNIEEIDFFVYQTGSGTSSSINDARIQIWNGQPNAGGSVIWGDLTTNVYSSSSFSNIYRVLDTGLLDNQRPVMTVVCLFSSPINLAPGTYWIEFQFGGNAAFSGPWVPPVTILGSTGNGNAWQNQAGVWVQVIDVGPQDFPFIISGYSGPPCPVEAASNPNPADGSTDVGANLSQLSWSNGAGAVTNEVYFGTNPGSLTLVQSGSLATSWSVTPTPLEYSTNYYWKVIEVGDTCNSTASVWSFKTEQNPSLQTVNLYPQSAQYWTGNTEGTTKTDGEINTVYPSLGWAAYDISSLPAGAVIDSVRFYGYVNLTYFPYWSATPMGTVNPVSDDATTIYNQVFNNSAQGIAYIYSDESSTFGPGWHNYLMGSNAIPDLQAAVDNSQGWFAMGFVDRDGVSTYYVNFDGWSQTNPPYIQVTYHGGTPPGIFSDNFDSYTAGGQLACQNPIDWTTWDLTPCSATTDAYISDNYAHSGANSFVVVSGNDEVHPIANFTTGCYEIDFFNYIPTTKTGYFNTLALFNGNSSEWGIEVYFNAGGAGSINAGGNAAYSFTYIFDTWTLNQVIVDLDNDLAQYWYNGTMICQWQWTLGASGTAISLQLGGNDFFGAAATDEMYVDDYSIDFHDPLPVEMTSFRANVSDGNVVLNWQTASEINNQGFEVQRNSGNGYEVLSFVQGNGTSTQIHNYSYIDKSVAQGNYTYRLRQVDFNGSSEYSTTVEVSVEIPKVFSLEQNYPNPFNPSTQINFSLAADSKVTLKVFNILGQEVQTLLNSNITAGPHSIKFNASNLPSGVYIYRIEANGVNGSSFTAVKKMILTK